MGAHKNTLVCLLTFLASCFGSYAQTHFLVKNGWTNTVLVSYADYSLGRMSVALPVGGNYSGQMFSSQAVVVSDSGSWDTATGTWDVQTVVQGDGSTNDLVVQVCAPSVTDGSSLSLEAFVTQYDGALAGYASSVNGVVFLSEPQQVSYFIGGFGDALPLAGLWYAVVLIRRGLYLRHDHGD